MADKKTTTQAAEQAALDPPAAVRNDIPLLTEKDIECRVQSVSRAKTGRVGAVLLLYKDARVDIIAVLSLLGTLGGSYFANKRSSALIAYRLEELEKKVDKHNSVVERTYGLEEAQAVLEEKIKVANHRIEDLENLENRA